MTQRDELRALLAGPMPLVLATAWDAGCARILQQSGARAIAVSAAGMAWAHGYQDVSALTLDELSAACIRVRRAISVPLVVDLGAATLARGDTLHELAYAVNHLDASGIVIAEQWVEDVAAGASREAMAARISALQRRTAEDHPARLVIVRVSGYTTAGASRDAALGVISRARLFADAGADVAFIPGADTRDIVRLVREIPIPVAVDIGEGWGPTVHGLARAGVRCVVLGDAPLYAAIAATRSVAREAMQRGTYDAWRRARAGSDVHSVLSMSS